MSHFPPRYAWHNVIGTVSADAEVEMVLSGLLAQLIGLWPVTGYLPPAPSGPAVFAVTALAAAALVSAVAAVLVSAARLSRTSAALPLISRAAALHEKSRLAAFLRQTDPDAAGRPRPRAPSAVLAAAGR